MNYKNEDGILTIYLEGSLDTNNAEKVGQEIEEIRNQNPEGNLVLDVEELGYISSAGLRQILKLRKKEKGLKIINCSSEVYDIFEMTGFTEMIDVTKAFRKINVEGCEVIGEGSNGIVYQINPDTIIKVYKNPDALEDIKHERELAKTALVMGINTAIPFDVVKVDDKYGAVFELLSSSSLTKLIKSDPDNRDKYIKVYADFLKEIHETDVKPGLLPSAKQQTLGRIEWLETHIDKDVYKKLHAMVEEIPESDKMVHGDYHTSNVHYDGNEAVLLDMDTLSVGDPIFDFAAIYLAYEGFGELDPNGVEKFLKIDIDTAAYIQKKLYDDYFEGKDEAYKESVKNKAKVLGYARVLRRTMKRLPDETKQIDYYREKLYETVAKVDDLII